MTQGSSNTGITIVGSTASALEAVELKSHFEKQGINYPISTPGALNESFTNTSSITITPRVTYVSGTSFVFDYNKTDVDLMNATTGWTAGTNTPTIAQDTTNKIEGTGSVKMTKASLNGSMDMYKTLTTFSLIDNLLSFSFYPDTVSNVTRFYVIIESSTSNNKTYYVPVANITALSWNHISIDVNNDTADATTGTLVPGSITKITFGYTTSSAQTVNVSVDFIVYQPNWLLPVPYTSFIYDGTNQEAIYIASVAGTLNHQRRTYTITALSNGYAVGAAYAKQRNVTILNNQGGFVTGNTGAVSLTAYDITTQELPSLFLSSRLLMSQRWWDEEFKINALGSTTTTGLYSATDKKAYFKTGDKVIIYQKRYTGRKYTSNYNSTIGYNFKILTLSADATYSDTTITLTHAATINSGADTLYWYAVRYSAEMLYKVEPMSSNGALNTLTPTVFLPSSGDWLFFEDLFTRTTSVDMGGSWIGNASIGAPGVAKCDGSKFTWYQADNNGSSSGRFYIPLSSTQYMKVNFEMQMNHSWPGYSNALDFTFSEGATDSYNNANTKAAAYFLLTSNTTTVAYLYSKGTNISNVSFSRGVTYYCTLYKLNNYIRLDMKTGSQLGAVAFSLNYTSVSDIGNPKYLSIGISQSGSASSSYIDNVSVVNIGTGYITRGSVDSQSGDKLVTATKLTRQDSTNQNPSIYQRDAILI